MPNYKLYQGNPKEKDNSEFFKNIIIIFLKFHYLYNRLKNDRRLFKEIINLI